MTRIHTTQPDGPGAGTTTRRPGTLGILALLAIPLIVGACGATPVDAQDGQGGGRHGQSWKASSAPASEAPASEAPASDPSPAASSAAEALPESVTTADLSADDVAAITYMREEEKLAHDVYVRLGELWGSRVFTNIAKAETAHMDAVAGLLEAYDIPHPAASTAQGAFTDSDLQALYDRLMEQGSRSLTDAFLVGATIEDLDIADLQERASANTAVARVFDNLERGSRNHLRAFVRQLDRVGATYTPAYISQSEYDAIVGGTQETGQES